MHSLCPPKGVTSNSGDVLIICNEFEKLGTISDNRNNVKSKQCKIHVFKFRIKQNYSTMVFALDALTMSPEGVSSNSGPVLIIRKKIEKIRYYFQHETQSKQCKIHVFEFRIEQN